MKTHNNRRNYYLDNNNTVPEGMAIIEEGTGRNKRKFTVTYDVLGNLESKREVKSTATVTQNRLKYLDDHSDVPEGMAIIEEGTGRNKRKFIVTYDVLGNLESKREVKSAAAVSMNRLKYLDDHSDVPEGMAIIEEGTGRNKRKFIVTYDVLGNLESKREVKSANAVSKNRLKYLDDHSDVPEGMAIIEEGTGRNKRKFTVTYDVLGNLESKREVKSAAAISKNRLKYLDDHSDVPEGMMIIEEGTGRNKRKFTATYDVLGNLESKREVKSADAVSQNRLKYLDDNTYVPEGMAIIEEGTGRNKRKFIVTYDVLGNLESKREVKSAEAVSQNRLKYLDDHSDVPEGMEIIEEGTGRNKRKFIVTYDVLGNLESQREVKSANTVSMNRLKYLDDHSDVPEGMVIFEEGTGRNKRMFTATYDIQGIESRREVKSAAAISKNRLKYLDDHSDVPEGMAIIGEGTGRNKRKFTATYDVLGNIESKREVKSAAAISNNRLKYLDDNSDVPEGMVIIEEGTGRNKRKFTATYDIEGNLESKREVRSANAVSKSRLKYLDDHSDVPEGMAIIEEGAGRKKRKFIVTYDVLGNLESKREVKSAEAVSKNRLKYLDDHTDVPEGMAIIEEGTGRNKRKFTITYDEQGNLENKREVKSADTVSQNRLKYLDDNSDVPEGMAIIEEGTGRNKRKFTVTYDAQGNIESKREVKSANVINRKHRPTQIDVPTIQVDNSSEISLAENQLGMVLDMPSQRASVPYGSVSVFGLFATTGSGSHAKVTNDAQSKCNL